MRIIQHAGIHTATTITITITDFSTFSAESQYKYFSLRTLLQRKRHMSSNPYRPNILWKNILSQWVGKFYILLKFLKAEKQKTKNKKKTKKQTNKQTNKKKKQKKNTQFNYIIVKSLKAKAINPAH